MYVPCQEVPVALSYGVPGAIDMARSGDARDGVCELMNDVEMRCLLAW